MSLSPTEQSEQATPRQNLANVEGSINTIEGGSVKEDVPTRQERDIVEVSTWLANFVLGQC